MSPRPVPSMGSPPATRGETGTLGVSTWVSPVQGPRPPRPLPPTRPRDRQDPLQAPGKGLPAELHPQTVRSRSHCTPVSAATPNPGLCASEGLLLAICQTGKLRHTGCSRGARADVRPSRAALPSRRPSPDRLLGTPAPRSRVPPALSRTPVPQLPGEHPTARMPAHRGQTSGPRQPECPRAPATRLPVWGAQIETHVVTGQQPGRSALRKQGRSGPGATPTPPRIPGWST